MGAFDKLKEAFSGGSTSGSYSDEFVDDYVEIGPEGRGPKGKGKVVVRPFVLEDFADIKPVLESIRNGYTVALVNIRPLREKDLIELKRSIAKLKKTCEAIEGDIAGFGEDWVVITPSFASIYRGGPDGMDQHPKAMEGAM